MAVKQVPEGFHTATPSIIVQGAEKLIDFVKQVFDAKERMRMPGPGGTVMHAEVQIGDSILMMNDPMGGVGPMPAALYLFVADCDSTYKRAVQAGSTSQMEPADMFWGDRMGQVKDPFGNVWSIATHKEDLSPEEQAKRAEAFFKQQ
jgi:PhnB protein